MKRRFNHSDLMRVMVLVTGIFSAISSVAEVTQADEASVAANDRPRKPAFLVPMSAEPSWREFAYLATVPAANATRPGMPVVVALDLAGAITPEVDDFLARYKPDAVYRIGDAEPVLDPDSAKGCVAHWTLDASPTATVGIAARLVGEVCWEAAGKVGGAAKLEGGAYLDCGRTLAYQRVGGMTVSAWVKPTPKGPETLISCGDGSTFGWVLGMDRIGRPEFSVALGDRGVENCGHLVKIERDKWAHLAGVLTADGTVKLFLNGRCVMMLATGSPLQAGDAPLLIGSGGGRSAMNGQIDDVRIHDRPLTDLEISQLADNPLPAAVAQPSGLRYISAQSADAVAVALAHSFWTTADRIVLCPANDYESALLASTIAARVGVPLMYLDEAGTLSASAIAAVERLGAKEAIAVGRAAVASKPFRSVTELANGKAVLKWMLDQKLPVDYFAVANPFDRRLGVVRKASLAAPVLAVARQGIVVPINHETTRRELWVKTGPAMHDRPVGAIQGTTPYGNAAVWGYTAKEPKLAAGVPPLYPVKGSFRGYPYAPIYLAASAPDAEGYDRLLVDENRDGVFSSAEVLAPGDTFVVKTLRAHTDNEGTLMRFAGSHGGPKDFLLNVEVMNWYPGTARIGDREYRFVVTSKTGFSYDTVQFDLNGNGSFGDAGEGPFANGEELRIDDRRWTMKVTLDRHAGLNTGDVTLTYPSTGTVRDDLAAYRAVLQLHPQYLCIVGLHDVIPFGQLPGGEAVSDLPYANADEDSFIEMAFGRVIGESPTDATLLAARSITYPDLIDPSWATRVASVGDWVTATRVTTMRLQNVGFDEPVEPAERYADSYLENRAVVTHAQHAAPLGLGHGPNNLYEGRLAPCLVESFIGCASCGLDLPLATRSPRWVNGRPGQWVASRMLQKGAVAYLGNTRNASAFNSTAHSEFWDAVLEGKTVGLALQVGLNTTIYYAELEKPTMTFGYAARMIQLYGDPALKIHVPRAPTVQPPKVTVDGDKVIVTGPSSWWENGPLHVAPGIHPEYADPGHFHVKWHTLEKVDGIVQLSKPSAPLGWNGKLLVDEHQDGSRTIHWRVKLIDYDPANGTLRSRTDKVEFAVTKKS